MKIGDTVKMNDKYYVSEKNRDKEFKVITQSLRKFVEHYVCGLKDSEVVMQ